MYKNLNGEKIMEKPNFNKIPKEIEKKYNVFYYIILGLVALGTLSLIVLFLYYSVTKNLLYFIGVYLSLQLFTLVSIFSARIKNNYAYIYFYNEFFEGNDHRRKSRFLKIFGLYHYWFFWILCQDMVKKYNFIEEVEKNLFLLDEFEMELLIKMKIKQEYWISKKDTKK